MKAALGKLIDRVRPPVPSGRLEGDIIGFESIYQRCKPYTMTSKERMYCLWEATKYVRQNIEGDIVECGVWKGGSCMLVALTLGEPDRRIFLYDTFKGMPEPTDKDVSQNVNAKKVWSSLKKDGYNAWCYASVDDVRANMESTKYGVWSIIAGKVEDTIENVAPSPKKIALLRVDVDWYSPTLCVLETLFPRLAVGGILIMDDYGYWQGARQAADEYFAKKNVRIFLQKIDHAGVIGVKLGTGCA